MAGYDEESKKYKMNNILKILPYMNIFPKLLLKTT
jgi:hypothetical protein